MPFVRIWIHLIWSTKNREPLLGDGLREKVFSHIKENAVKKDIYLDTINGVADHVHCLVSLGSDQTISKVAQLLKGESSHWANHGGIAGGKLEWQDEYFAVSVSDSIVGRVRDYIRNQKEHHRVRTFCEEYEEFIQSYSLAVKGYSSDQG